MVCIQSFAYDFHIHTALSPCGDNDMTPNNIVNMALLKKLDIIAITDHNTCCNVSAVMNCAKGTNLTVIPGMEVETSEEVHVVCLFKNVDDALKFNEIIKAHLPIIKNNEEIFGEQIILNEKDEIIGKIENLLVCATTLSINELFKIVLKIGGVCFPAHIDKQSYSIISNLGFIPPDINFKSIEIKDKLKKKDIVSSHNLSKYKILHNSDAHYLENISERENFIHIEENSILAALKVL